MDGRRTARGLVELPNEREVAANLRRQRLDRLLPVLNVGGHDETRRSPAAGGTLVAYCALGHRACHFQVWK